MTVRTSIGWVNLLSSLLLCSPAATASDPPRSVDPAQAAWAAKLPPIEIAARAAAPFLRQERFIDVYTVDMYLEALLTLGDATGEKKYLTLVQDIMLKREMPPGHIRPYEKDMFSSIAFEMFERTRDPAYVEPFLAETRKYRAEVLRAFDGAISFYREERAVLKLDTGTISLEKEMAPILVDQMQEYASRMARAGYLTGEQAYYAEAAEQFELFRSALRDPATGLWAHGRGWFESARALAATKWGRGHGWVLRGLVETLTYMPPDSAEFGRLSVMLNEFAATLLKYQDAEGFWHQVIDRQDSYQETSATGLISYYFARAVRQKLLPEQPYRAASVKAFEALARKKVSAEGVVYGASEGTPPMASVDQYLRWKTPVHDGHGVPAVILAAAGQLLLDGDGTIPGRQAI